MRARPLALRSGGSTALSLGLAGGGLIALVLLNLLVLHRFFRETSERLASRWMSTLTLVLNHIQTAAVLGSLPLPWPASLKAILDALRLQLQVPIDDHAQIAIGRFIK